MTSIVYYLTLSALVYVCTRNCINLESFDSRITVAAGATLQDDIHGDLKPDHILIFKNLFGTVRTHKKSIR